MNDVETITDALVAFTDSIGDDDTENITLASKASSSLCNLRNRIIMAETCLDNIVKAYGISEAELEANMEIAREYLASLKE